MKQQATRLMNRICAARLDPSISPLTFTGWLEELVDVVTAEPIPVEPVVSSAGRPAPWGVSKATPHETDDNDVNVEDQDGKDKVDASNDEADFDETMGLRPLSKISYDERIKMRQRYDEAMEGRQRAPNGFLDQLAAEYNCSYHTVKLILYRQDGT